MWENTYQIVYDKRSSTPPTFTSVEVPMNEGADRGYTVISFDAGMEEYDASAVMKCIACHAVDEGRTPNCSVHGHQRR